MTAPTAAPTAAALPQWVAWLFLGLLVLPFDPHWIDFEQVRRGLLLMLTGGLLLLAPRLPRVRHEGAWLAFVAFLAVAALISYRSLQPTEAWYRIAHFLALLFVLRLGAACADALAAPFSALLALTSTFGLLQSLGAIEFGGYGSALEPVSVFGNLNVASEWTAVAAMAVLVLPTGRRGLQYAALALAGAYLVVNGSRSGLLALGLGALFFVLKRRQVAALTAPAVLLGGAAIGLVLALAGPQPPVVDDRASIAMQKRATKTIEVRLEIAAASTQLFAERPLFGFGPGQFQVQYPRVRSQQEIELSSHSRQFASEVRTAHDDWLELLVEGGLPIVLLFAAALFALQRGTRAKERLLPLFVVLLLMIVRSPLANAPAIAAALLPVATALPRAGPLAPWRAYGARGLGLLLLVLGLLPVVAHTAFAPYVAARARGEMPDIRAAMRAHAWMWWEPRWLQVLAQEQLIVGNLQAARKAAAMASALRPHDPQLLLLVGETLARGGAHAEAAEVARHALAIDPRNPELRVLRSTTLMLDGHHDAAIEAVCDDPHPRLRQALRSHFQSLGQALERQDDALGAARCRVESLVLQTLESMTDQSPGGQAATNELLKALNGAARTAGVDQTDLRPRILYALHFLALDKPKTAVLLADQPNAAGLALKPWQRRQLGEQRLQPLLEHEVWFEVLRRRAQ